MGLGGELVFPESLTDIAARELIEGLLIPHPGKRLGCNLSGYDEIRSARFFMETAKGANNSHFFELLMSHELKAPVVPSREAPGTQSDEALEDLDLFSEGDNGVSLLCTPRLPGNAQEAYAGDEPPVSGLKHRNSVARAAERASLILPIAVAIAPELTTETRSIPVAVEIED